jgi:DNA-binding transcriptional regulator YdaS (Cro superfamily)
MNPTDVMNHYETQQQAAAAIGIAQASIAKWLKKGVVPALRQLQLEAATGGALKADKGILPRKTLKTMRLSSKNKVIFSSVMVKNT